MIFSIVYKKHNNFHISLKSSFFQSWLHSEAYKKSNNVWCYRYRIGLHDVKMDCKGQDQYFTEDVVLHIRSVDIKRNRVLQINSIYPLLTCWLFLLNQRVVRLISVLNCSKFDYDLEGFLFPIKFLLWGHEKMQTGLMTSSTKNTSFCMSLEKNNQNYLHIV